MNYGLRPWCLTPSQSNRLEQSHSPVDHGAICEQICDACKEGEWPTVLNLLYQLDNDEALDDGAIGELTEALPYAVLEGQTNIVEKILGRGVGLDHQLDDLGDIGDVTALHIAVYQDNPTIVRMLLKHAKATNNLIETVSHQCYHNCTPLLQALAEDNFSVIDVFIEENAIWELDMDIDPPDTENVFLNIEFLKDATLLHLALIRNADNLSTYLIQKFSHWLDFNAGENLNENSDCSELNDDVPDMLGTPLHVACRLDKTSVVKQIIEIDSGTVEGVDALRRSPIFYCAENGNLETYALCLRRMNFEPQWDGLGESPLHKAVRNNHVSFLRLVKELLEAQFDDLSLCHRGSAILDAEDQEGNTLLQIAARDGRLAIVELLYKSRFVDINHRNNSDRTAYQLAAQGGHHLVVELLQRNEILSIDHQTTGTAKSKRHRELMDHIAESEANFMPDPCDPELNRTLIALGRKDRALVPSLFGAFMFGHISSSHSDDSDEGETAAHLATRRNDPETVNAMVKDARLSTHQENAKGETVIQYARRNQQNQTSQADQMFSQFRAKQMADCSDSSTGGSSSDAVPYAVFSTHATSINHSLASSICSASTSIALSIQKKIEVLNQQIKSKQPLDLRIAEQFVVAHFRGVNFNRNDFKHKSRREYLAQDLTKRKIYCTMSYENAELDYTTINPSQDDLEELNEISGNIKRLWSEVLSRKHPIDKWWDKKSKKRFSRLRYAIQHRYTVTASKNYGNGQYESTWHEIWSNVDLELKKLRIGNERIKKRIDSLDLSGNLFISTGKTAEHAVRYACGWSHASHSKSGRSDPRYKSSGKPKYPHVGIVYTFMHTIPDYMSAVKSDVCQQHRTRKINVFSHYLQETEVSFVGDIEAKHIAAVDQLVFPDFERTYDQEYHYQCFGLTSDQYDDFKSRFSLTQRPQRHFIKILDSSYHEEYRTLYQIDEQHFNELRALYRILSDKSQELTKEALKPYKHLFSRMLDKKLPASDSLHASLLFEFSREMENYLVNIARGPYQPEFEKTHGLCEDKFNALSAALSLIDQRSQGRSLISREEFAQVEKIFAPEKSAEYEKILQKKGMLKNDQYFKQAVLDAFRGQHPYRRLKNELRHHFAGGTHPYSRNLHTNGFLAERLLAHAKNIAQQQGKTLVYFGADGLLYLMKETSREVKKDVTAQAKEHLANECLSSSDSVAPSSQVHKRARMRDIDRQDDHESDDAGTASSDDCDDFDDNE